MSKTSKEIKDALSILADIVKQRENEIALLMTEREEHRNKIIEMEEKLIKTEVELRHALDNIEANESVMKHLRGQIPQNRNECVEETANIAGVHDAWDRLNAAFSTFKSGVSPKSEYDSIVETIFKLQSGGAKAEPENYMLMQALILAQIASDITSIKGIMIGAAPRGSIPADLVR